MTVVWESDECEAAGAGGNHFKTKHLFINDDLNEEKCLGWAEIIWAARSHYKQNPTGITPSVFQALKKAVGGVKPPQNGLLCVNQAQLQQLVALIEQSKGSKTEYEIPSGTIVMMSKDADKCWTSTNGGKIFVKIEVIGDKYQVWHCDNMTGKTQVKHPF